MKQITLAIVLFFCALGVPGALYAAYPNADIPWWINRIDTTRDVDEGLSIAYDPVNRRSFITYHDTTTDQLWIAISVDQDGNCGPDNAWYCMALDDTGSVGQYSSIDVIPDHNAIGVSDYYVSYFDSSNESLKYVEGLWKDPANNTHFAHTIATGNTGIGGVSIGLHSKVKLDSSGAPHIAYQIRRLLGNESVYYASFTGGFQGGENCGEGAVENQWICEEVALAEGVGADISLDLDSNDKPHIAYYDSNLGYPLVAIKTTAKSTHDLTGSWVIWTVQKGSTVTGPSVSIWVDSGDADHLAYYNETDGTLEYAYYVISGGNCGFSSQSMHWEWQCDWIDDMGSVGSGPMGIAIDGDALDNPVIAYEDASSDLGPTRLKLARPYSAMSNVTPNCGPNGGLFYEWFCEALDDGGLYTDEASSIAMTSRKGLMSIAYHENDHYPYPAEGNLKTAFEPGNLIFSDDFECGNTDAWTFVSQ